MGVPSGVIRKRLPKPAEEVEFETLGIRLAEPSHVELEEAKALYWEALSTNNPFHRFLSFWRIYERVTSARREWRKNNKPQYPPFGRGDIGRKPTFSQKRKDTRIIDERMPEMWVWSTSAGQSFAQVSQELDGPYRDALAHADGKRTKPRTPLRASDVSEVAIRIPTVQYIARVVIQNLEATLNS